MGRLPTICCTNQCLASATLDLGSNLLKNAKSPWEAADAAAAASITVVKPAGYNSFFIKSFQISISKNMNWDMVPGKICLRRATASLVFRRQKKADRSDAYLGVDGKLEASGTAHARLTVESDDVFVALACNIGPSRCLNGSEAMDLISGEPLA